ncbi:MAG: MATE family efflux transporter [Victivallaceae bacterium]|nr:MATE family efflux transporter [Victivallaceae bacterium]
MRDKILFRGLSAPPRPGGFREILRISYPLVLMSASHMLMQFCDRTFLARNSTLDVTAAFPAGFLFFCLFCFYMATGGYTSALVAQFFGAGKRGSCVFAVWSAGFLMAAASLLVVFLNPWIGHGVIRAMVDDPVLAKLELTYFDALIPSGVFSCLWAPFCGFFSGRGKTKLVAAISIFGCLLNVPLDYWMIFGAPRLGIPAMGIAGAGWATSICTGVTFLMMLGAFLLTNQRQYPTRRLVGIQWAMCRKILRYGTPAGSQIFLDCAAFAVVTFSFGKIGTEALTASVLTLAINNIFFMPLMGLADGCGIVVGQYIGRGEPSIAEKAAVRAWKSAMVYMIGGALLYVFLPEVLIMIFAPAQQGGAVNFAKVVEVTKQILLTAVFFNFCDATKFTFAGALRGAGDTLAVLLITSGGAWLVMMPGTLFLIFKLHASVVQVWIFLACYALVEASIVFWRFHAGCWRKINLIGGRNSIK